MFKDVYNDEKKLVSILNRKSALVFYARSKDKTLYCKTKKFTGVRTICRINCEENQKFYINFKTSNGKGKILLIKDKKIYQLVENDFEGNFSTDLKPGKYRLRLVGNNVDLKIELKKK